MPKKYYFRFTGATRSFFYIYIDYQLLFEKEACAIRPNLRDQRKLRQKPEMINCFFVIISSSDGDPKISGVSS